ncbi:MAG: alpha hydrolase [Haloglomus sp.]
MAPTEARPPSPTDAPPAWVLFSAGKDSALAALCLEPFFDVTLVTVGFGVESAPDAGSGLTDGTEHAAAAAASLGLPFRVVSLPVSVAHEAAEQVLADGHPNEAIQSVHERALEAVATTARETTEVERPTVADGTRRDDRVPRLDRSAAQSLEDRNGVDYVVPLRGHGRAAVDRLVGAQLAVTTGPSDEVAKADYETAIRAVIRREHGPERVDALFPEHTQSRVTGRVD